LVVLSVVDILNLDDFGRALVDSLVPENVCSILFELSAGHFFIRDSAANLFVLQDSGGFRGFAHAGMVN